MPSSKREADALPPSDRMGRRRKRWVADGRLRELEAELLLEHVLDTMPAGLLTVDSEGILTSWNAEMEAMLGYSADEVLGKSCSILGGNECVDGPCAPRDHRRCGLFVKGELHGKRCTLRARDGRIVPVLKHARLMHGETGQVLGGIESVVDLSSVVGLRQEVAQLRRKAAGHIHTSGLVGHHPSMQRLLATIDVAGPMDSSVLIQGETGTGKELVARAIHQASSRRSRPFVSVSCAALPETLLESELFGHVRGAFTGAVGDRKGRFEEAQGGTIFLDEIGDAPLSTQRKLLRVLQERELERVGQNRTIRLDIRVIAATHRDLRERARQGLFREDLFYRLKVIPVRIPPLRERASDIPLLVDHFIFQLNEVTGKGVRALEAGALKNLLDYAWPGNVRELENAMEYAFALAGKETLSCECFPGLRCESKKHAAPEKRRSPGKLEFPGEEVIREALRSCSGNKTRAAKELGVSRVTLWKWLKAHPQCL